MSEHGEEARLENQLVALARATVYPQTPNLAAGWCRLEADRARQAPATPLSLATAGVAALVIAVSVIVGTVTPARDAAADLFDRINIFETDQPLDALPTDITGEETTLDHAEFALGRAIRQPSQAGLGLDRVVLQEFGSVIGAALFYSGPDGQRFVLYATNSHVGKGLPQGGDSTSTPVAIPEKDVGFWLEGRHLVQLFGEDGRVVPGSERVTDFNTLLWPEDDLVYKIEGDLSQEEAIAIAASVQ